MLIDRYITRAQVNAFVVVFVSLAGLYIVFDAFTNMDEFSSHAAQRGGLARVLGAYYGVRLIWFFDAASPVITLASAMFALAWLERHNELTALLAAGIDRWRLARPTLVFATVVSLVAVASRETVIPRVRQAFARNAQDLAGDNRRDFSARYDNATEILFRGASSQAGPMRIEAPSLVLPAQFQRDEYGNQIDAAEALWRPATADHPAGYLLNGVSEPAEIDTLPQLEAAGRPAVITRATAAWLEPRQCFVCSDVTFEQLVGDANWSQYSSTPELVAALRNPALGLGTEVPLRIHARFTTPLLDMVLTLLGIPLVLGPIRRGVFVAIGQCVLMTIVFFLVVMGCHALAASDVLGPAAAAWLPLLVLGPLAAWRAQPMWQ
jgi:lipopolysaccharide export system permease protein